MCCCFNGYSLILFLWYKRVLSIAYFTQQCMHTKTSPKFSQLDCGLYFIFMRISQLSLIERCIRGSPIPAQPNSSSCLKSRGSGYRWQQLHQRKKINKCNATIYQKQIDFIPKQFGLQKKCVCGFLLRGVFYFCFASISPSCT